MTEKDEIISEINRLSDYIDFLQGKLDEIEEAENEIEVARQLKSYTDFMNKNKLKME